MAAALLLLDWNERVDDLIDSSHLTTASPVWQLEFAFDVMVRRHEIPVGCMAARTFANTSGHIVYFRWFCRLFGSWSQFSNPNASSFREPGLCAIAQRRSLLVAAIFVASWWFQWDVNRWGKEEFQRRRGGATSSREENPTSLSAWQKVFF